MRKVKQSINDVIESIKALQGEHVCMEIQKGRNRVEKYNGVIESVYPSIFVVKANSGSSQKAVSYSYSDVLCGDVTVQKQA